MYQYRSKKPIFDDYQPSRLSNSSSAIVPQIRYQSVSRMHQSQSLSQFTSPSSIQKREKIFQLPKQPMSLSKASLIKTIPISHTYPSQKIQQQEDEFKDFNTNSFDLNKPLHFQLDQVTNREQKFDFAKPQQAQIQPLNDSRIKNDKFVNVGMVIIVILIFLIILLKLFN
ncbi:hypothetical protein pb186bvf_013373 [Paramecium bursaria]